MAVASKLVMLFTNGKKTFTDSKNLEVLWKSIGISADGGVTNTLTISENSNKFDFGSKVLGGITGGTVSGQALTFDQIGANSGVAGLDSGGKIPSGQLPNSVMQYQATFNPSTHLPNLQNTGAAIKAVKVVQGLTYAAKAAGALGNLTSITYVNGGVSQSLTVGVVDKAITVNLATDGGGVATSTADDVKTAVEGYGAAAALVDITGTGAVALIAASQVYLVGGADAANAGDVYKATAVGSHDFGSGAIAFVIGDYAIYNNLGVWELSHSGADAVISVDGQTSAVVLSSVYSAIGHSHATGDITNFATDVKSAAVANSITDGVTDVAPSQNAVFDALALKADSSSIGSGEYASFTNKEVGAITIRQFVKMTVVGQVTLLTSTDTVADETFFGCVKSTTVAADAPADIYLPKVGARISGFSTLDVTKLVYAHATTPGSYTQTMPITGKSIILGRPISASEIIFLGYFDFEYA